MYAVVLCGNNEHKRSISFTDAIINIYDTFTYLHLLQRIRADKTCAVKHTEKSQKCTQDTYEK